MKVTYDVTIEAPQQPKPVFAIRKRMDGGAGESNEPCGFWRGIWWAITARPPNGETWCLILLRSNPKLTLDAPSAGVRSEETP